VALLFHATVAIKAIILAQRVDYHAVRVVLTFVWVTLSIAGNFVPGTRILEKRSKDYKLNSWGAGQTRFEVILRG
jgi:hypothetical protein